MSQLWLLHEWLFTWLLLWLITWLNTWLIIWLNTWLNTWLHTWLNIWLITWLNIWLITKGKGNTYELMTCPVASIINAWNLNQNIPKYSWHPYTFRTIIPPLQKSHLLWTERNKRNVFSLTKWAYSYAGLKFLLFLGGQMIFMTTRAVRKSILKNS